MSSEERRAYFKKSIDYPGYKEKKRIYDKERRSKNVQNTLYTTARARAKNSNLEFNLDIEDVIIPEYCPLREVKLDKENKHNAPSLDRIDNTKGYIKGNVRVISRLANLEKRDLTLEKLEKLLKYIKGEI